MPTSDNLEVQRRLVERCERASRKKDIVTTCRGEQVERVLPPAALDVAGPARALAAWSRRSRAGHTLSQSVSIQALIEEGRR